MKDVTPMMFADAMACGLVLTLLYGLSMSGEVRVETAPPSETVTAAVVPAKEPTPAGTFAPAPMHLCLIVDGSSSMEGLYDRTREGVLLIAAVGAKACAPHPFKLTIVRLRDDASTATKHVGVIAPSVNGVESAGMKALRSLLYDKTESYFIVESFDGEVGQGNSGKTMLKPWFSTGLSHISLEKGLMEAERVFRYHSSEDTVRLCCLIGDQGWFEADRNPRTVLDLVANGSDAGHLYNFCFVGDDAAKSGKLEESRSVFKAMAAAAGGGRGSFSEAPHEVVAEILSTMMRAKR